MPSYIAIDLKSFYASVECVERGLDPLNTNLVVADRNRTEKTICLAVSPALKTFGVPGRPRLFEVVQRVKEVNARRAAAAPGGRLGQCSWKLNELTADPVREVSYLVAPPRMAHYMAYSTRIYQIYLKYVAPEDIHVYSIDEVFMDVTSYLKKSGQTAHDFAMTIIRDVLRSTGITATAGIGSNLYLCKIAMDIVAKKMPPDADGVRIAELDEMTYRRQLWDHRPLTSFWRVGHGYAAKLEAHGMRTMGDVARMSLENEELLYRLFGVNAELLIDHAWGWEPCTIADIRAFRPESNSISSGQVLQEPYPFDKARLVVKEMTDLLVLDLVDKGLVTDQMVLTVGYDVESLSDPMRKRAYAGPVVTDPYGRPVPKPAHGSIRLKMATSSTRQIMTAVTELFDRIVDRRLMVRRMYVVAAHVMTEADVPAEETPEQMDIFTDYAADDARRAAEKQALDRERKRQQTIIALKKRYGKNAVLKAMNLQEGATARDRNRQIGGHKE